MDLPLISAIFLVFAIVTYALLDGFDLGVGVLLLFQRDESLRDRMIDSITPIWDGNETWLIMGGVALFAAFPIAYGVLLSAFYVPVIVMLLALGLRGVCFEFRFQSVRYRRRWDVVFAVGSIVAALCQGAIVGGMLTGVNVRNGSFAGGPLDWISPLSVLMALTVVIGYALRGAAWLYLKGEPGSRAVSAGALRALPVVFTVLGIAAAVLVTQSQPGAADAWRQRSVLLWPSAAIFTLLGGFAPFVLRLSPTTTVRDYAPMIVTHLMFASALFGIVVLVSPNIIPFRVSLWDAASATSSHVFLLIGAAFVTPVVLAYSAFAFYVFRGKTPAEGWES